MMAQKVIAYSHEEVARFLLRDAAQLSGKKPEDLQVKFEMWEGRLAAYVRHKDPRKDIEIYEDNSHHEG
jgi:hypothetical protein